MKKTPLFILVAALLLVFQSCRHTATSGLVIPKDASMIVYIDGSSLTSKLNWDDIKSSDMFKKQYQEETDDYKKTLMNDPEASGVNIKSDFAYFSKKESNGEYFSFEGKLKDATAFETFTTKMAKDKKIEKDGDLSYVKMDQSSLLLWNKSIFMVFGSSNNSGKSFFNQTGNHDTEARLSSDSLLIIAKGLLDLPSDKLINDDDRFTSLIKESGDIHLWMNNEQFSNIGSEGMLSMMKVGDIFKGNFSATTINFEKGKISAASKTYLSKEVTEFFKTHKPEPVSADLINRIPSQNVSLAIVLNMPPEGLVGFLKIAGLDGFANIALQKYKLTVDDVVNAYKGEMVLALSDASIKEKVETFEGSDLQYKSKQPDGNYFLGIAVKNKASFQKFLDIAKDQLDDFTKMAKVSYKLDDNWFVASNSSDIQDKFLAGGNNHQPFTDKISGHPFGMYIDLQKIIPVAKSMMMPGSADSSKNSEWQDIVISGGDFKDGIITSSIEVNLTDKSANSLKILFNSGSGLLRRFHGEEDDDSLNKKDQVLMNNMNNQPDTSTVNTTDPSMLQNETPKKSPKKK